jgi:hypothetical protein
MKLRLILGAVLLVASSTVAMAQGGDCCAVPGQGKDDDNNPSVWGASPETGNTFGSSNIHHPDMTLDSRDMATAPVAGTPAHRRHAHEAVRHRPRQ